MKVVKFITLVLIIMTLALSSRSLLPTPNEIDNMEILKLVGIDYDSDSKEASVSFMIDKEESSVNSQNNSQQEYEEVLNFKEASFNEIARNAQFYSDKTLLGSHVKYFLIGEDTARNNIDDAIDYLTKDKDIRLSSHIYLVKDMGADEFLKEIVKSEYKLADKLTSMEDKGNYKTIINYLNLSDMLSDKVSDSSVYLIPTLELQNNKEDLTETKNVEDEKSQQLVTQFSYYGYGIMKDNKLVDYLDKDESIIYNMLINKSKGENLEIIDEDGNDISFGLKDISTKYSYKFDESGKLNSINIKMECRSDFEEVHTRKSIAKSKNTENYEKLQEKKLKKQIEKLINKSKNLDMDILKIGNNLNIKHPYKYRKNKELMLNNYKDVKINVDVVANIDKAYDIVQIHK